MNGMLLNSLKSSRQVFADEGVLFYPQLFEGEELDRLREACERVYENFMSVYEVKQPERADNVYVMRHLNDLRYHPQDHAAGREGWRVLMETIADARCVGLIEQIFGACSLFYTTSLFFNPRAGREEGQWHRDQQFMFGSEDEVRVFFENNAKAGSAWHDGVQLQIALVDNEDIEYVPFSAARYDSPQEYFIRCADERAHSRDAGMPGCRDAGMPGAMRIHQRAGDAVAFNPSGLHRGRYDCDVPRRTLMLTYTPKTAPAYTQFSDQPWMLEPDHLQQLSPRARVYFEEFIETYREFWTNK